MGEVIHLKTEEPAYCFVCGCGCQEFILMFGGMIECKGCGYVITTAVWTHLPPEIREGAKR